MRRCFKCKNPIDMESISFKEECRICKSDLHICLNCIFYDEGKANKCRETQAEYVKEKDRANYCDYFRFKEEKENKSGREDAENLWKELFKKQ